MAKVFQQEMWGYKMPFNKKKLAEVSESFKGATGFGRANKMDAIKRKKKKGEESWYSKMFKTPGQVAKGE